MPRERTDGLSGRRWLIPEAHESPPIAGLEAPEFVGRLLRRRGIDDVPAAHEFLQPEAWMPADPSALGDWDAALERVARAAQDGEIVAVYGDYDVDGITGTAILSEALTAAGIEARRFIPHRERDGYGIHAAALAQLAADGAQVLITADCGITAIDEIETAQRDLGMDVVVLDHHEPAESLPPAAAVVSPQFAPDGHPLGELSTGGLAYRFAQALLERLGEPADPDQWLDLAALSTVADVVPLRGENRWLVWRGLQMLAQTDRPGLRALIYGSNGRRGGRRIDTETIGFTVAPRINAAGRLDRAELALDMLLERNRERARALADELERLNQERRRLTEEAMERAQRQVADLAAEHGEPPLVIFAGDDQTHHGVVGIVAGRLADEWGRPAFAWARHGGGARASGRSVAGFDLVVMLETARELLDSGGGHAMAAAFSADPSHLGEIARRLNRAAAEMAAAGEVGGAAIEIDAQVDLSRVTPAVGQWIERLAPFGQGNPTPLFLSTGVLVESAGRMGAEDAHLRLRLRAGDAHRPRRWTAVAWRMGSAPLQAGDWIDAVWSLRRGLRGDLELEVRDFAPASGAMSEAETAPEGSR